jgi:NAD(P)-dependent dehydrogenase (short-subunit alcohol dehydrogenase family)
MRYLITGGAGFIGSHLADRLIGRGDEVVVLDDLSTGSLRNVTHLEAIYGSGSFVERSSIIPLVSELVDEAEVVVHPPRRWASSSSRTAARVAAHEHPRDRDRARSRRVLGSHDPDHIDLRDLRQERVRSAARRRRSDPGVAVQGAVVVLHEQGGR